MDGVGEAAGGLAELAFAMATDSKGRFNLPGCLFTILIVVLIGLGIYFYNKPAEKIAPVNKECGTLIMKLKNNEVIVLLNGEKVVRTISSDLYLNTKDGQEICFTVKNEK